MIYIKLNDNLSLTITVNGTIHAGDNMSQKITYLVPAQLNEVDMQSAYIYLSYICADGSSDMVRLERLDEMYNQTYYQYQTQVTCRLSKYPGTVRTWLNITLPETALYDFNDQTSSRGTPAQTPEPASHRCGCPVSVASGECLLYVEGTETPSCCSSDNVLTALTQMQSAVDSVWQAQADLDVPAIVRAELDEYDFNPIITPWIDDAVSDMVSGLDARYDAFGAATAVRNALSAELSAMASDIADDIQELRTLIDAISTVPVVTVQDNGKFMRVVNGQWVADSVVDVSQEGM